ncbi:hypothetical protein PHMEG_00021498 [Phytophthora megakarya]|uniref:Uncharacterized protein n=1 Tax=Phytophthora megakarya TaxID=4795 RepID=A0A225VLP4_9STRA|nr:hypothetical protein PHMEG_00021498 [Phytophthora megakarya]
MMMQTSIFRCEACDVCGVRLQTKPIGTSTKKKCNKREDDLWHEYLEYLNFIESLMEGDQTKMVMEVFGNNVCPDLAPTLLPPVPDDTQDYIVETDRMKRLLYKLRGDGRKFGTKRDDRKIRNSDRRNHSSHNDRSHDRNNPG